MATAAEIADYDTEELERQLSETRRELFNLRFQLATGQLDNFSRIGHVKKDVARMLTELRNREIAEAEGIEFEQMPAHLAAARRRSEDEAAGRDQSTASERRAAAKAEAAQAEPEAGGETDEEVDVDEEIETDIDADADAEGDDAVIEDVADDSSGDAEEKS